MIALLVLVVVFSWALGTFGERAQSSTVFAEDLRDQTLEIARASRSFQELLGRMASIDRVEFTSIVGEVGDALRVVEQQLETTDDPLLSSLVGVLRLALDSWEDGVDGFGAGVLEAADGFSVIAAGDSITAAMIDLRTGDRLYSEFVRQAGTPEIAQPVSDYPRAVFVPTEYPIVASVSAFVNLASATDSPLKRSVNISIQQVTTQPEWVKADEGLVVDAVDALTVLVVVANAGNVPADATEITVSLSSLGDLAGTRTLSVPELGATDQTTLQFEPFDVTPGIAYDLSVSLGVVPGERDIEDNGFAASFRVNQAVEETSTTTTEG